MIEARKDVQEYQGFFSSLSILKLNKLPKYLASCTKELSEFVEKSKNQIRKKQGLTKVGYQKPAR